MDLISPEYRKLNRQMHEARPFGGSGHRWAHRIIALRIPGESILDYGCGMGTLKDVIPDIQEYDPAVPGKDKPPKPADLVACTDVLEHVEPECLSVVLKHIREMTLRMAFVVIATRPSRKLLPDGSQPHRIIKPPKWWVMRLRNAGFNVHRHREPERDWERYGECQFRCL